MSLILHLYQYQFYQTLQQIVKIQLIIRIKYNIDYYNIQFKMADLSEIFKHKPQMATASFSPVNQNSSYATRLSSSSNRYQRQANPSYYMYTQNTGQSPNSSINSNMSPGANRGDVNWELSISRDAKKIITYDSMQDEVSWFDYQNLLECLIKICIAAAGIVCALYFNIIAFKTALSLFIFSFLLLGLHHNIFGAYIVKWAYYSLIGTTLVLSNQVFLFFINKISHQVGNELFYFHTSLIPAAYVTVLIAIVHHSLPILTQHSPRSFISVFWTYPKSVLQLLLLIYQLKFAIAQTYAIMLIATFAGSLIYNYGQNTLYHIEKLFTTVFHPFVLIAEVSTFLVCLFYIHFLVKVISTFVSKAAIIILYNQRNRETKIPIILELLRLNSNDVLPGNRNLRIIQPFASLLKKFYIDFPLVSDLERKLTRNQLQNIYKHSLNWISNLVLQNQSALKTKVYYSKYYNTYFDIFKQFAQSQLARCSSSLFQLGSVIESYNLMRVRSKSFKEDLFYWVKVVKKQFQIWAKAIQGCRALRFIDQIMEIINYADLNQELWASTQIGVSLTEIRDKAFQLKQNRRLNPVIRSRMSGYSNKISRIVKS